MKNPLQNKNISLLSFLAILFTLLVIAFRKTILVMIIFTIAFTAWIITYYSIKQSFQDQLKRDTATAQEQNLQDTYCLSSVIRVIEDSDSYNLSHQINKKDYCMKFATSLVTDILGESDTNEATVGLSIPFVEYSLVRNYFNIEEEKLKVLPAVEILEETLTQDEIITLYIYKNIEYLSNLSQQLYDKDITQINKDEAITIAAYIYSGIPYDLCPDISQTSEFSCQVLQEHYQKISTVVNQCITSQDCHKQCTILPELDN